MPASASTASLLRFDTTDDGIATVWLDDPDASVNKISEAVLDALTEAIARIEDTPEIRAAVFISGKDDSFVAGADLDMLKRLDTPADVRAISETAHQLLHRVRTLGKPTVAAINGAAMGGGLELTLGCTYRIATTHDKTKLALPEVQLGLLPGGGGTQYLPRLVGLQQALGMMLTGKNIYPKKAKRIGLVDALTHPPGLHHAALMAARELADGTRSADRSDHGSLTDTLLESNTLSRRFVYQQAGKRTAKQTRGNYPAPPKILDAVKTGLEKGLDAGLQREAQHFGDLVFTPESRALVSLFFAKQTGDKHPNPEAARPVRTVGIIGAGLMGAGIANASAKHGTEVRLKDQSLELAAKGKKHIWQTARKQARKGIISTFERDQIVERVVPTGDYAPFASADVVIEAVPEDLELKQQVLSDLEAVVRPDCVLASNTSSIPIADIAAAAQHPERVLGMHYFSPVEQMPLLEIIATEDTSDEAIATARTAGRQQGKTVIVVQDGPGFYTTRILAIYMNEALLLLEEGADAEAIDRAMKDWGFPMGPYELFDLVGIDVAAKITKVMEAHLDTEQYTISHSAEDLVDVNLLGEKTKRGFYNHETQDDGDLKRTDFNPGVYQFFGGSSRADIDAAAVQERLGLMMVNEAIRCLDEGILRSPTDGDLGAVFGLGFPPFRGGPFRYIDQEGPNAIRARLRRLAQQHGPRFAPPAGLEERAAEGRRFHDDAR
ncbi:3-hydroxyacyl-CoA dehydrogenase NAD-binding domain-containing protein [Salisaeta longa]|uniref:3-hydroxyacyl-CoA dehydrogenase NAD-binding domain-containing protein n=1 Tax=Salisaeta longa TaxID=503170 RepID=UPI0003B3F7FF|nr:3-hydroxyacyl-CoA dehydrogenase NAD-binding domain-containing protein [Salisaeta longa]